MNARTATGASAIAALLTERIEQLATALVGSPPTYRSKTELRYYPRGGLVLTVAGPKRGLWCSHGEGAIGGDALDLVKHFRRCSTGEALDWSRRWLGIGDAMLRPVPAPPAPQPAADHIRALDPARSTWRASVPAAGTPVESYLRSRGLTLPPNAPLRFHPACCRGTERLPAMVAIMTDPVTAKPTGVHRTFLAADGAGKADGEPKKAMLGRAGIIRLVPDEDVTLGLGIAEGIETALAIMQRFTWRPVWAATSAGAIAKFPVLDGIERITIFADRDQAGLSGAQACTDRWKAAGRESAICIPPTGDWADQAERAAA